MKTERQISGFLPLMELCSSDKVFSEMPAFLFQNKIVSYKTLFSQIEGLSQKLQKGNFKKSILYFDNTYWFAVAFIASLKAGLLVVLPQNSKSNYLRGLMQKDDVLLTDSPFGIQQVNCILVSESCFVFEPKPFIINSKQAQINFYTSGSTGEPKLVQKTLFNLEAEIETLHKLWGSKVAGSLFLSTVSHQHIYGLLFRLLWPLSGGNLIHSEQLLAPEEFQVLKGGELNRVLISSPALLKRLPDNLNKMNFTAVFSSGGFLHKQAAEKASAFFNAYPVEVFGSTETGGIAYRKQNTSDNWTLFPKVEMQIDANTRRLKVKSPYITKNDFIETGDTIEQITESSFILHGRDDGIIKLEEKRVSLKEIENKLLQHPFVEDCFALTLDNFRQSLGMLVELKEVGKKYLRIEGKAKLNNNFKKYLKEFFDDVLIPRKWRYIGKIPVNSAGKVLRIESLKLFQ